MKGSVMKRSVARICPVSAVAFFPENGPDDFHARKIRKEQARDPI
jgi:hypothetical protein